MSNPSNPNGANQYHLDPRQKVCWSYYINPTSDTFMNGLQSALKAGYEATTANQITTSDWFIGKVRRLDMLEKAEKVLHKTLDIDHIDPQTGKTITDVLRIKVDVGKHLTKTLGKEDYSERIETTGKDGDPLVPTVTADALALANELNELYKRHKRDTGSNGASTNPMDTETPDKE